MAARNVENYRAGHEAFNRRDFGAMTEHYADGISGTDHAQGRTFGTPEKFRTDFLAGWLAVSSDILITDARYLDAGQTVVATFTVASVAVVFAAATGVALSLCTGAEACGALS